MSQLLTTAGSARELLSVEVWDGLTALRDALATPHGGAEATADALMALAPEHIGDDIALLVVTVPGETSGQSEATMSHQTHLPEPVE